MGKNILVMGGTRYVGKLLVQRLLDSGHTVTLATRGLAADPFGARVQRIVADRRDHAAMRAAFAATAGYDIVYDQLMYNPLDAAIAIELFAGKVKRYVMASTIEVYRAMMGRQESAFAEGDLDLGKQVVDMGHRWLEPTLTRENYAIGKRQAEALLYRDGSLPLVSVRIGHVLGGDDDVSGRLAHYVHLVQSGQALLYTNPNAVTSFAHPQTIADFLEWTGMQDFLGPVNAASNGALSALDLHRRVGAVLGEKVRALPLTTQVGLSPFDFALPYELDTTRARSLGYRFGHLDSWLDLLIHQHQPALVSATNVLPLSTATASYRPRRPSLQTAPAAAG